MKSAKNLWLVMFCIGFIAGCGNSNPVPSSSSLAQNGGCNPYSGYPCTPGNGILPPGVSSFNSPLYGNGGVTFSGNQIQVSLGTVNAGDQITASNLNSLVLYKNCGNSWISFNMGTNAFQLYSPTLAVNGAPLPFNYSGFFTAPAAGSLTLIATANVNASCVRRLTPQWSLVSGGYSNSPVAYVRRCTNQMGAFVPCQ